MDEMKLPDEIEDAIDILTGISYELGASRTVKSLEAEEDKAIDTLRLAIATAIREARKAVVREAVDAILKRSENVDSRISKTRANRDPTRRLQLKSERDGLMSAALILRTIALRDL